MVDDSWREPMGKERSRLRNEVILMQDVNIAYFFHIPDVRNPNDLAAMLVPMLRGIAIVAQRKTVTRSGELDRKAPSNKKEIAYQCL